MIIEVEFEEILNIWNSYLWPNRTSKIESHSAMLLNKTYDIQNFNYKPSYFIFLNNQEIAGCNSGHLCSDNTYRSRGLFVFPEFRKKGIGIKLLEKTVDQGKKEKASKVWSYPRHSSWSTYLAAGFILSSEWEQSEVGTNAYCVREL